LRINIYIFRILQQSIGFFYIENGQVQYDLELERERIRQEEKQRAELEKRQWEEEEQKRFNEKEARLREEEVQLTINIVVRLYNQNSCANVTVFEGPSE
jgi:lipase chaperone LimK